MHHDLLLLQIKAVLVLKAARCVTLCDDFVTIWMWQAALVLLLVSAK